MNISEVHGLVRQAAKQARALAQLDEALEGLSRLDGMAKELNAAVLKARTELGQAEKERDTLVYENAQMVKQAALEAKGIRQKATDDAETATNSANANVAVALDKLADLQETHEQRMRAHEDALAVLKAEIAEAQRQRDELTSHIRDLRERLTRAVA